MPLLCWCMLCGMVCCVCFAAAPAPRKYPYQFLGVVSLIAFGMFKMFDTPDIRSWCHYFPFYRYYHYTTLTHTPYSKTSIVTDYKGDNDTLYTCDLRLFFRFELIFMLFLACFRCNLVLLISLASFNCIFLFSQNL